MNTRRAALWVGLLAVLAYANTLGNGFAYDDTTIVVQNPVVQEGRAGDAFTVPYWPRHSPGSGLYRPVTVATFAIEWGLFEGNPAGFHAVNVALHALVSILVLLLLVRFMSPAPALVGALVFAVHPLHTEAVANVVGRGELLAALFTLLAALVYLGGRTLGPGGRAARLLGIGVLYVLGLASKEIAVTLPGLLLLIEAVRKPDKGEPAALKRIASEWPVYAVLTAGLGAFLLARLSVVGAVLGELPAPSLRGLDGGERVLTALSLWPHYLRLLVVPFDLSADYSPGVLFPARTPTPEVIGGGLVLAVAALAVGLAWKRNAPVAIGIGWFLVAVLPVSQLFFPTGVLLAERTLYLPSIGVAWLAAALWSALVVQNAPAGASSPSPGPPGPSRRVAVVAVGVVLGAFLFKTVQRNPTWTSTFTVLQTLVREHPESSLALRTAGASSVRAGDMDSGTTAYEAAVAMAPFNYSVLTEVGHHYGERSNWTEGERVLRRALAVAPDRPAAYRILAGQFVLQGRYRDGHRMALDGLAAVGSDRELWALVSETYVAKGDFEAALRARRAALAVEPDSPSDLTRLADIHEFRGDTAAAVWAREAALRATKADAAELRLDALGRLAPRSEDQGVPAEGPAEEPAGDERSGGRP